MRNDWSRLLSIEFNRANQTPRPKGVWLQCRWCNSAISLLGVKVNKSLHSYNWAWTRTQRHHSGNETVQDKTKITPTVTIWMTKIHAKPNKKQRIWKYRLKSLLQRRSDWYKWSLRRKTKKQKQNLTKSIQEQHLTWQTTQHGPEVGSLML